MKKFNVKCSCFKVERDRTLRRGTFQPGTRDPELKQ